ncbi:MAG TPA: DUF6790 family protein [Streptosporangiaceae bacterium]|nr:DUF6790 family protein [Streptosporangiaceae bacterium]
MPTRRQVPNMFRDHEDGLGGLGGTAPYEASVGATGTFAWRDGTLAVRSSPANRGIVWYFAAFWIVLILGFLIHWQADRRRHGPQPYRALELLLLWVVVFGGLWTIVAGLGLTSGNAYQHAISGGYAPSMYAWEVGWADIALGALGVGCARKSLRGQWMTAAVTVLAISYEATQSATSWP